MLPRRLKKMKDHSARIAIRLYERKKRYLKFMLCQKLPFSLRNSYRKQLGGLPHRPITNYCLLSGRARGVYRTFKLSRHQIKKNFIFLTGLRTSSW